MPGALHGLPPHRLAEHVEAEGPLVAPVEGFKKFDGAVVRPGSGRQHSEGGKTFAADARLIGLKLVGRNPAGKAHSLHALELGCVEGNGFEKGAELLAIHLA